MFYSMNHVCLEQFTLFHHLLVSRVFIPLNFFFFFFGLNHFCSFLEGYSRGLLDNENILNLSVSGPHHCQCRWAPFFMATACNTSLTVLLGAFAILWGSSWQLKNAIYFWIEHSVHTNNSHCGKFSQKMGASSSAGLHCGKTDKYVHELLSLPHTQRKMNHLPSQKPLAATHFS